MRLVDRSLTQFPCSDEHPDFTSTRTQRPCYLPHEKAMKHTVQKGTCGAHTSATPPSWSMGGCDLSLCYRIWPQVWLSLRILRCLCSQKVYHGFKEIYLVQPFSFNILIISFLLFFFSFILFFPSLFCVLITNFSVSDLVGLTILTGDLADGNQWSPNFSEGCSVTSSSPHLWLSDSNSLIRTNTKHFSISSWETQITTFL